MALWKAVCHWGQALKFQSPGQSQWLCYPVTCGSDVELSAASAEPHQPARCHAPGRKDTGPNLRICQQAPIKTFISNKSCCHHGVLPELQNTGQPVIPKAIKMSTSLMRLNHLKRLSIHKTRLSHNSVQGSWWRNISHSCHVLLFMVMHTRYLLYTNYALECLEVLITRLAFLQIWKATFRMFSQGKRYTQIKPGHWRGPYLDWLSFKLLSLNAWHYLTSVHGGGTQAEF